MTRKVIMMSFSLKILKGDNIKLLYYISFFFLFHCLNIVGLNMVENLWDK